MAESQLGGLSQSEIYAEHVLEVVLKRSRYSAVTRDLIAKHLEGYRTRFCHSNGALAPDWYAAAVVFDVMLRRQCGEDVLESLRSLFVEFAIGKKRKATRYHPRHRLDAVSCGRE